MGWAKVTERLELPREFRPLTYSHDDFGARLFESITVGLYAKPLHAIREYVQNELDPYPKPTRVKIRLEGNRLSIWGDGKGMDENDVEIAKKVGVSDKNPHDFTGFRGIGIWSGVAIADEILISTKKSGSPKRFHMRINGKGIRREINTNIPLKELLEKNVSLASSKDAPLGDHFTHVELKEIIPGVKKQDAWSEDNIRRYIAEVLPVPFDPSWPYRDRLERDISEHVPDYRSFLIEFNGRAVYRPPFLKEFEAPKTGFIVNEKRKTVGFYWFCLHKKRALIEESNFPRLVFKKKGFTVGDRRSCVQLFKEGDHLVRWTAGEIHVVDDRLVPDAERMDFENSLEKEEFMKCASSSLGVYLEDEVRKKSYSENLVQAIAEVDMLALQPAKFRTTQEKMGRYTEIEKLERKLESYAAPRYRSWTPEDLRRQRDAKLDLAKRLKSRIQRARPSPGMIPTVKEPVPKESETPSEELSLVEVASELKLKSESKIVMEAVDQALTDLTDSHLRIQIKNRISDELRSIFKGK